MNVFLLVPILDGASDTVRGEASEAVRARERVRTVKLSEARCR